MNYNLNTVASLVREDLVTATVKHSGTAKEYTYKILKSLAETLENGDLVLVENSRGVTVGSLIQLHDEAVLDLETDYDYRWIFQRVDVEYAKELVVQDKLVAEHLKKKKVTSARAQVLASFGIDNGDEIQHLLSKTEGSNE
ncbi:hypothetical protein N9112_00295 [bacterium]|nr:hypothetical protein [bacterium]